MASKRYSFEPGGAKRLQISFGSMWRNTTVRVDGQEVGRIAGARDLKAGRDFALADGSTLHVRLGGTWLTRELQVLRDGRPLPGSASDPVQRLRTAYGILFVLGGINVALGLLATLGGVAFLSSLGLGVASAVEGLVYGALAYFVRRRSRIALAAAVGLFGLDTIAMLATVSSIGAGGLFVHAAILFSLCRAFPAIQALRAAPEGESSTTPTGTELAYHN